MNSVDLNFMILKAYPYRNRASRFRCAVTVLYLGPKAAAKLVTVKWVGAKQTRSMGRVPDQRVSYLQCRLLLILLTYEGLER
jgi:hypothetical protein